MQLFTPSGKAHWYDRSGQPRHTIPYADPKRANEERPTTLKDARKLNLLPSVTTILRTLAKPQLDSWKQTQAVMAALTLPRNEGEIDDDFARRVVKDAEAQVALAADRGIKVHAAIETFLLFGVVEPDVSVRDIFMPFVDWANANVSEVYFAEKVVIGNGYAGTLDLCFEHRTLGPAFLDIKTRKRVNGKTLHYNEDDLQLAAYWAAHGGNPNFRRFSLFIDPETPSEPDLHEWNESHEAATAFNNLFEVWKYVNKYRP